MGVRNLKKNTTKQSQSYVDTVFDRFADIDSGRLSRNYKILSQMDFSSSLFNIVHDSINLSLINKMAPFTFNDSYNRTTYKPFIDGFEHLKDVLDKTDLLCQINIRDLKHLPDMSHMELESTDEIRNVCICCELMNDNGYSSGILIITVTKPNKYDIRYTYYDIVNLQPLTENLSSALSERLGRAKKDDINEVYKQSMKLNNVIAFNTFSLFSSGGTNQLTDSITVIGDDVSFKKPPKIKGVVKTVVNGLNAYDISNLARYILYSFVNQNTDIVYREFKWATVEHHQRKVTDAIHLLETSRIKSFEKFTNNVKIRVVKDHVQNYTEIESIPIIHGHHASPCTHVRSGYYRRLKSGKRVWVNETVVNPGGPKNIYQIGESHPIQKPVRTLKLSMGEPIGTSFSMDVLRTAIKVFQKEMRDVPLCISFSNGELVNDSYDFIDDYDVFKIGSVASIFEDSIKIIPVNKTEYENIKILRSDGCKAYPIIKPLEYDENGEITKIEFLYFALDT